MNPNQPNSQFDLPELPLTYERVFERCGTVDRKNYKRSWVGCDYLVLAGKFNGFMLSSVTSETWLQWALDCLKGYCPDELKRALIDQLNSLHT